MNPLNQSTPPQPTIDTNNLESAAGATGNTTSTRPRLLPFGPRRPNVETASSLSSGSRKRPYLPGRFLNRPGTNHKGSSSIHTAVGSTTSSNAGPTSFKSPGQFGTTNSPLPSPRGPGIGGPPSLASSNSSPLPGQPNPYMIRHDVFDLYNNLGPEDDDWLHEVKRVWNKDRHEYKGIDHRATCFRSIRGIMNICVLFGIIGLLISLFLGYPVLIYVLSLHEHSHKSSHGLGGTNLTGQVPLIGQAAHLRMGQLIDPHTPKSAYTKTSLDGKKMNLVFSDEFEVEGRSFYPGDDPFWEALDVQYWETGNYEWYDPAAITTKDGALWITFEEHVSHNKNFRSGMMSSWNKFCFTGGRLEASVVLPGANDVSGFWPAVWLMGNLGRAGFGATTHGTWPYLYDSCDVGTLPNQTYPPEQGGGPEAALVGGEGGQELSWLPGQRLSACTCPGEDHPGPILPDGTLKGRGAPELDLFEAMATDHGNFMSMSLQVAPFNNVYWFHDEDGGAEFTDIGNKAGFRGGKYQQCYSGVGKFDGTSYELSGDRYDGFAVEWTPGKGPDKYLAWFVDDGKMVWKLTDKPLKADKKTEISDRMLPEEPMYIIMNLGMGASFSRPVWDKLKFPAHMKVDYVRVYQNEGQENVGCDPKDFPTKDYIDRHMEAYTNWNLTAWTFPRDQGGYEHTFPKNRLLAKCDKK